MSNLTDCISQLDNAALDVFEVGCRWQEKTPASVGRLLGFDSRRFDYGRFGFAALGVERVG